MTNDAQLLRRYLAERSQEAFAELVRRHIGWVYHAALRRTGGRHDLAQEVAQYVFTAVAKHAESLSHRETLSTWLYVTLRFAAGRALRSEVRRRKSETAAQVVTELDRSTQDPAWERIRPALDAVMDKLSERDRETLLLRFFEGMSFADVGAALGVSEDGARKRVERSLEKLRVLLARRGVTSTGSAVGALLAAEAGASVGSEVAATVTAGALSGAALPGASVLGFLQFMSATKASVGGVGVAAALLCVGTLGTAIYQTTQAREAEAVLAAAMREQRIVTTVQDDPTSAPSDAAVAPNARSNANANATARADAKAFLAAFDGELGVQYRLRSRREIEQRYALFFRLANLPEEKRRALVERTVKLWEESLEVTPSSIMARVDALDEATLRAILGDEGFRQWDDLVVRAEVAKTWATEVAKAVSAGTEPVTLGQLLELHQLVREESPEYPAGGKINDRTVDWDAVVERAKTILSPAQWEHAQTHFTMRRAMHALEKLAPRNAGVGAVNRP